MTEAITSGYRRLFEIRLLHHYWLDDGATIFDAVSPQPKRDQRLLQYDARTFVTVSPTAATATVLKGLGCVFKETGIGCVVGVPKDNVIPDDTSLEFIVTVTDPAFFNYTALTLRPRKIYQLYYQPEDKFYRYKENVPVLSNLTGASRGSGVNKALFLSGEIPAPAADDPVEALVLSGGALLQLTGDQPGAATQQIDAQAANQPVYLHQGDAPPITPPAGLTGAPPRGVLLTDQMPDQVFAVIRLAALRGDDADFSLTDGSGHAKAAHPVFQVRFKNRSSFRRYIDKSTGIVDSTEAEPTPLTYFGNAGTKQKPSQGLVKPVTSGARITQIISEIFV